MKKFAHISSWLLVLTISLQLLSAHSPPYEIRPISHSRSKASDAASLVQAIHFQQSKLEIRLHAGEETSIEVYNLLGQMIASRTLIKGEKDQEVIIPMQRYQVGTYLIFVKSPQQMQSFSLNTASDAVLP